MSSRLAAKQFFQAYQLVASEVGTIVKFLKETSCMSPEKRFELACCRSYREYFLGDSKEDKEFADFLEKIAEPTLTKLGFAEWNRDILTDLGLRVSKADLQASLKELKNRERD